MQLQVRLRMVVAAAQHPGPPQTCCTNASTPAVPARLQRSAVAGCAFMVSTVSWSVEGVPLHCLIGFCSGRGHAVAPEGCITTAHTLHTERRHMSPSTHEAHTAASGHSLYVNGLVCLLCGAAGLHSCP
jgi:hypothetical protein